MAYIRKTRDEYQLLVNYGYGYEYELVEDTFAEAKARLREYRANLPQYAAKIVKRRVAVEA